MEVILREHVEKLGRRGDVVTVADGYARNYLIPRKLAMPATEANRRLLERQRRALEAREAQERASAEALAARLAETRCVIPRRVGETDTLYGSVTATDIAEALAAQGFAIEKRRILLAEPIKTLGEVRVPVKLHRDVVAEVQVAVVRLEESK
jgi:large subunit ribosomal protein L9